MSTRRPGGRRSTPSSAATAPPATPSTSPPLTTRPPRAPGPSAWPMSRLGADGSEAVYINAHGTPPPQRQDRDHRHQKRRWGGAGPQGGHQLHQEHDRPHAGRRHATEAVATVLALYHGVVPPRWGLQNPRSRVRSGLLPQRQAGDVHRPGLSSSLGFGGTTAASPSSARRAEIWIRKRSRRLLPHRDNMLLVQEAEVVDGVAHAKYHVSGEEWFLKGPLPRQSRGPRGHPL